MNPTNRSPLVRRLPHLAIVAGVCALLAMLSTTLVGDESKVADSEAAVKSPKTAPEPLPIEVHFRDGSTLKVVLREEHIDVVTPYGKLQIPVADIRQIDFGFHLDAATIKRVDAAIANLGNSDFKVRKAAMAELLELGESAYPALVVTCGDKDPEVARSAETVVSKLRDKLPMERLDRPNVDVVQTVDSKFTGRIAVDVFKVKTVQFGDQQVKLGDIAYIGSKGPIEVEPTSVENPSALYELAAKNVGKTFVFRVTAPAAGAFGTVWGSGVYTSDSDLGTAAVHAGVLKPGKTGLVKVLMVIPPPAFDGTTQNGVTTYAYQQFPGAFQIVK